MYPDSGYRPELAGIYPDGASVAQIAAVVSERELKLRQALRTMGMLDSSYWLSWVAFEVGLHHTVLCHHDNLAFVQILNVGSDTKTSNLLQRRFLQLLKD